MIHIHTAIEKKQHLRKDFLLLQQIHIPMYVCTYISKHAFVYPPMLVDAEIYRNKAELSTSST